MRLEFSGDDYFSVSVLSPSVNDVTYCQLRAEMKCGNFTGAVDSWFDRGEVMGFIASLDQLNATLRGEAMLTSEDGGRSLALNLFPSDRLGHFVLKVHMGRDLAIQSNVYETQAAGVFPFEAQALGSICEGLKEGVTGKSDA